MNKEYIKFNLSEAVEQLKKTLERMDNDKKYSEIEYELDMEHAYHHLNHAWNARNEPTEKTKKCEQSDFDKWRQFPTDIDFGEDT